MSTAWDVSTSGVLRLPSGRLLRGRGLSQPAPEGQAPDFGLYLLRKSPPPVKWEARWVKWPDFGLPRDLHCAEEAMRDAWTRASGERVEIACGGGRGRTGTALACIAVLDGIPADAAVAYIRKHYDARAVETPWQRRYVASFLRT